MFHFSLILKFVLLKALELETIFLKFSNSKLKHPFSSNKKKNGTPVFQKLVFFSFGKRGVRVLIKSRETMFHFFTWS